MDILQDTIEDEAATYTVLLPFSDFYKSIGGMCFSLSKLKVS